MKTGHCEIQNQPLASERGQYPCSAWEQLPNPEQLANVLPRPNWSRPPHIRKLMQTRIWLGILVGSTIGGFIPDLWGAGLLSYSSVLLSGVGAFVGLWLAIR
jgi:hypothetical protein